VHATHPVRLISQHVPAQHAPPSQEVDMVEHRTVAPNEDPVCGMTVDPEEARAKGLARTHDDREYIFCGKGCLLDFGDDPEAFLAADYVATM
jgi:YHS domain-containing protein